MIAVTATTAIADQILADKKIFVIPDILANAGGVLGSYLEWDENVNGKKLGYEQAKAAIAEKMKKAYREVEDAATREKITLRQAAYLIAVDRIAKALKKPL